MATQSRIFVAIPSYRDSECQWTVIDLFNKAANPDNIFLGICWQCDQEEDKATCFQAELPRTSQIRIKWMHWKDAQGPCIARYHTQQLWNGEEYYLQIDSHMRFVKDWDKKLIEYMSDLPPKSILTTYPVGYELPNKIPNETRPCVVVADQFGKDGMLRFKGKMLSQKLQQPCPTFFWVSGFAFSRSDVIQDVPYDPNLEFLFFGEEISMNARLWTHGWNFYSAPETLIYHLWTRSYRPTFREIKSPLQQLLEFKSLLRVKFLLGMITSEDLEHEISSYKLDGVEDGKSILSLDNITKELSVYGLGSLRTLEEYQKHVGVNLKDQKIDTKATFGGVAKNLFLDHILDMLMTINSNMNSTSSNQSST